MFVKFFVVSALLAVAFANPCSTGPVQCCNSIQNSGSKDVSKLLAVLGVIVKDVNVPVGLNCNPISVIGAGSGANCQSQPVCCKDNTYQGIVNIGCSPVNVNL